MTEGTKQILYIVAAGVMAILIVGGGGYFLYLLATNQTQLSPALVSSFSGLVISLIILANGYVTRKHIEITSLTTQAKIIDSSTETQQKVVDVSTTLHNGLKSEIASITADKVAADARAVAEKLAQSSALSAQAEQAITDTAHNTAMIADNTTKASL